MKDLNNYISEKFKISKDIKVSNNIYGVDDTLIAATKLHNAVFTDFSTEKDEKTLSAFSKWAYQNDVKKFVAYFDNTTHLGGGIHTACGNIDYNPNNVKTYAARLSKASCLSLYGSSKFNIICNEILKKSDTPTLYISTPDTRFVIIKDN